MRSTILPGLAALTVALTLTCRPVVAAEGESAGGANGSTSIKVEVTALCDDKGVGVFTIFNRGQRWPDKGVFAIYRLDGGEMILRRSFVLGHNQQASFRIKKAKDQGEMGLRIEPSWYKREIVYDAKLRCA